MTPLISADTGDGAAGWASGSHTCSGSMPALAPKPKNASRNATVAQKRAQVRPAQRVEGVVAAAAVQHAEAEQDGERADVRDQQIDEARLAVLLVVVLGGDQEIRRERHRLPRDHEEVGVVGDQHERHAREEHVILQVQERERRRPPCRGSSRRKRARCRTRPRPAAAGRTRTARRRARETADRAGPPAGSPRWAARRSPTIRSPRARATPGRPRETRTPVMTRGARMNASPITPSAIHATDSVTAASIGWNDERSIPAGQSGMPGRKAARPLRGKRPAFIVPCRIGPGPERPRSPRAAANTL